MDLKHWAARAAILSCLVFGSAGCNKEEARAEEARAEEARAEEARADMAGPAQGAEPAEASTDQRAGADPDLIALDSRGTSKVVAVGARTVADTPTYKLTLAAPAKVSKGAQGTVTLEIVPKPGWKLNKEFPTKLTVAEPAGVKVAKKEQTVADAVAFAEKSGKWSVEFEAESAGEKAFVGQIKFAVCTETSCDPKKEQLAWNVSVTD